MTIQRTPETLGYAVIVRDDPDPTKITTRRVKNLGWLQRHWRDVTYFEVTAWAGVKGDADCTLKAHLDDGRYYATGFADRDVLWDWLKRPIFKNVRLLWFNTPTSITLKPEPIPS